MRISDWSSDVCSSDLPDRRAHRRAETDRALLGTGCEMPRVREQLTADAPIVVIERRMRDRAPRPFIGIGLHLQRAGFGIKAEDRKSVVSGQSVSVRVELGGRRIIKQKQTSIQL